MSLEKLLKQKEALEAQIIKAEQAAKNKNRVERLVVKLVSKHQGLFTCDLAALEKNLDEAISAVAEKLKQ